MQPIKIKNSPNFLISTCCPGIIFRYCSFIRLANNITADWFSLVTERVTALYSCKQAGDRKVPEDFSAQGIQLKILSSQVKHKDSVLHPFSERNVHRIGWSPEVRVHFPLLSEFLSRLTNAFGSIRRRLFCYLKRVGKMALARRQTYFT